MLAGIIAGQVSYAQTNTDSLRIARQHKLDSTRKAQKRYYDSMRVARQHKLDSTREAQKKYYDSLRIARQHRLDSTREAQQKYFDSMRVARQHKLDSTRAAQKRFNDSVQTARKRILDSTRTAQKKYYDSLRVAREQRLDSIRAVREHFADSLAAIREYRQSDHYKDSVTAVRTARLDSIKTARQHKLDSMRAARKHVTDSIVAVRRAYVDSIKVVQKHRSDSLAKIREYRQSKRYKDSVTVVRKLRLDSIKAERKAYYDSIASERKHVNDSIASERKARLDSAMAVRQKYTDSLKAVRKVRSDSLAKLKEQREKERKVREKQREKKAELALELKIKKKREAWSNEKMLKKKWGPVRRVIQNTFTRYNYYFNADKKMDEAVENMQRFRRENYDSLLALYPFDPDRDSSVLAPDMDSIIQKASLGIQIHDPRTKWGDDLYLLLGQAYYYKGDYENASDAFKYVVSLRDKNKKKNKRHKRYSSRSKDPHSIAQEEKKGIMDLLTHRSVHNQAILWLARTYTEWHKEGSAESVLDLLEVDPNFPGSLEGRLALEKAYIRLSQEDYRGSIEYLAKVADDKKLPEWVRMRAAFINGQLQQRYGDYESSAKSFRKVLAMNPKLDMGFYARKNIATSLMLEGGTQEEAVAMLEKVLKDGKYVPYYEQVYYLLGRLAANSDEPGEAITYLNKGINSPKATASQKAQSYATLGNVYYDMRQYEAAKVAYDSAAALGQNVANDTLISVAIKRSAALVTLTEPLRTIRDNDSLLALAKLEEKEQRSYVRKYIKMLEDRRADSIFRAQNAGLNSAQNNAMGNNGNNSFSNWYFANPTLMQKGYNAFKQKWGNRPLSDNWRRSSSGGFIAQNGDEDEDSETDANGIPTEEALLAAIPNDQPTKDTLLKQIRRAYVDAGNAYIRDLEDYPPAIHTLDTFEQRFANNEFKAEVLYMRYLVALKQNELDDANTFSQLLTQNYPDTKWAKLVKPTEDGAGMEGAKENVADYYDKTYDLLLAHQYEESLPRAVNGQRMYNIPAYKDKFLIVEAASLAMLENFTRADSLLTMYLTTHTQPQDTLRRWAEAIMKYIGEQRAIRSRLPGNNPPGAQAAASAANPPPPASDGPAAATAAGNTAADKSAAATTGQNNTNNTTGQNNNNIPQLPTDGQQQQQEYEYNADEAHYVLFSFPKMEPRAKGVEAAIKDFNKFKFGSLGLETEASMLQPSQGVITIRSFRNKNQALIYVNTLKKTKQIFREYTTNEYRIVMISASNYQKLISEKDFIPYLKFYIKNYK